MQKAVVLVSKKDGTMSATRLVNALRRAGVDAVLNVSFYGAFARNPKGFIIRWGCRAIYRHETNINQSKSIATANNKPLGRQLLLDAGLHAPKLLNEPEYPCLVRPIHHTQKKHFYICENENDYLKVTSEHKSTYIQEIVDIDREFRVNIFKDDIVAVYEKKKGTNDGWTLLTSGIIYNVIAKQAKTAIDAIGIDTAGVDFYKDKAGNIGIFEVNSMPTIKTNALADMYAKTIIKYLEL
jgi:carbamoylphosphate synthase large subunit